jgi:hypothetical protein
MTASMRRNNGDAVFHDVERRQQSIRRMESNHALVPGDHRQAQRRRRNMVRRQAVSPTRSRFGLLLAQTEHSEQ